MLAFILLDGTLELGIPLIDQQHRDLAELINELILLAREGEADLDAALPPLQALYEQTRAHFRAEETLMATVGYAQLPTHRTEHQLLLAELRTFVRQIEERQATLDHKAAHALKDWLVVHVVVDDRAFAAAYHDSAIPRQDVTPD